MFNSLYTTIAAIYKRVLLCKVDFNHDMKPNYGFWYRVSENFKLYFYK